MLRPSTLASTLRRLVLVIGISGLAGVLLAGLALPVTAGLGLTAREGADTFVERPGDYPEYSAAQRSTIRDAGGDRLATVFDENRVDIPLDKMSANIKNAILAIEDDRFYERGPIDFQGTARALVLNLGAGETRAGGSTLTQQYVKLLRVDQAQTPEEVAEVQASSGIDGYTRKLDELRMAINVEKDLSKDQILQNYLNMAFFGAGAYGVEAAAQRYFSMPASELQSDQAAVLAGLVQAPSLYDPIQNPEAALNRRNVVLARMLELDMLTQEQYDASVARPLRLEPSSTPNGCVDSFAGFYCDYVVHEIRTMEELGGSPEERENALRTGGLTVHTALSRKTQKAADEAVSDRVAPTDEAIASAAVVEPATGYIRALANSREYGPTGEGRTVINYAVDKNMGGGNGIQNGSTNKVFVLAAAIEQGIGLNTSITAPSGRDLGGEVYETCDGIFTVEPGWAPVNSTGGGRSTFNLRTGTEQSINTFYVALAQRTGLCDPTRIAQEAGVRPAAGGEEFSQFASYPLGAQEVSPLGLTSGYAMFANRGVSCKPMAVTKITDAEGNVVVERKPDCNRVMKQRDADTVNDVLRGVIENPGGTGARMRLDGREAAGKTGTTNGSIAVWFGGYTPQLAATVAVADVEAPQESLDGLRYNGERIGSACGGCIPGPIWKTLMEDALDGVDAVDFPRPGRDADEDTERATVPDVRGLSESEARRQIEEAGFEVETEGRVDSDLPVGTVVSTSPGPGSERPEGSTVGITLSSGRDGSEEDEAEDDDEQLGQRSDRPNRDDDDRGDDSSNEGGENPRDDRGERPDRGERGGDDDDAEDEGGRRNDGWADRL